MPAAIIVGVGVGALIMLTGHANGMLASRANSVIRPGGAATATVGSAARAASSASSAASASSARTAKDPARRPGAASASGPVTLVAMTDGLAGWIAVGSVEAGGATEPTVLTSADGVTWHPVAATALAGPGTQFLGVAAGHGGYVVVGRRTAGGRTFAALWWSTDLRTWTEGSNGGLDGRLMPSTVNAVVATPDGFVAVGSHGSYQAIWTSRNGRNWNLHDLRAPAGARSAALRLVVAAGTSGSRVVATGYAVAGTGDIPVIVESADGGSSWHEIVLGSVVP